MSAPPPPVNMNALIAAQIFQAMMGYSMIQPSGSDASPSSTSQNFNFAPPGSPYTLGFQVNTTVQITPHMHVPGPGPEPEQVETKEYKSEKQLEKTPARQLIEEPEKENQTKQSQETAAPQTVEEPTAERGSKKPEENEEEEVESEDEEEVNEEEEQEVIIEELKELAFGLKKGLLRRFKKRNSEGRIGPQETSAKGSHKCTYPSCSFRTTQQHKLHRHIPTHYPEPYFCPICHTTFPRPDKFDAHFFEARGRGKGDGEACVETEEAMRYEVAREKERFNFYWLGAMEDYLMCEEHFEVLAHRKRGEVP